MTEVIQATVVAVVLFAATNLDDIFILIGFYASGRLSPREVIAGQYVGMAVLVLVSWVAALIALVVPPAWIGLLGLAPIALGVKALFDRDDDDDDETAPALRRPGSMIGRIASVAAITIANGGDNIGVYIPLFATQTPVESSATAAVFALLTGLWCLLGLWLVRHPVIGAPLRRWGPRVTPFVLIGLGLLILYESRTFSLLA